MTQLTAGVSAGTHRWPVDTLPEARYLRAGDELVEVLYRSSSYGQNRIRVRRGIEGSTPASHASGTELEAPVFGAGGGEQTIRRFGPFEVNFDDENLVNPPSNPEQGAVLYQVPNGVDVIKVWAVFLTKWNSGTSAELQLQLSDDDWNTIPLVAYDAKTTSAWGSPLGATNYAAEGKPVTPTSITSRGIALSGDAQTITNLNELIGPLSAVVGVSVVGNVYLTALITEAGAAATAGKALVYALTAEPA